MTGGEFFVDHPTLRGFIAAATGIVRGNADVATKLSKLRAPYKALLSDPDWLPEEFKQPSGNTTMGHGIASLLLYRSELKDLSLSTLVVAPGLATPVHNHLAWGLVGLYQGDQEEEDQGDQEEEEYDVHEHAAEAALEPLKLRKRRLLKKGDFYELVPPWNDIHRVRTISSEHRSACIYWRMISAAWFGRNLTPTVVARNRFDPVGAMRLAKTGSVCLRAF